VERPRDPFELVMSLRDEVAELRTAFAEVRTTVAHLSSDMAEVKQDIRRLDDRLFQLMLLQLGTIASVIALLVSNLVS